jgi:hypothetical protein
MANAGDFNTSNNRPRRGRQQASNAQARDGEPGAGKGFAQAKWSSSKRSEEWRRLPRESRTRKRGLGHAKRRRQELAARSRWLRLLGAAKQQIETTDIVAGMKAAADARQAAANTKQARLATEWEEMEELVGHLKQQREEEREREAQVRQELEARVKQLDRTIAAGIHGTEGLAAWWREYRQRARVGDEQERAQAKICMLEQEMATVKKELRQVKKNAAVWYGEKAVRARENKVQREIREANEKISELRAAAAEKVQANGRAREKARQTIEELKHQLQMAAPTALCAEEGRSERQRDLAWQGDKVTQGTQTVEPNPKPKVLEFGWSTNAKTFNESKRNEGQEATEMAWREAEETARARHRLIPNSINRSETANFFTESVFGECNQGKEENELTNCSEGGATEDSRRCAGRITQERQMVGYKAIIEDTPTWAQVANDEEQRVQLQAIWGVKFTGRTPRMGEGTVIEAMLGAVQGKENFKVHTTGDLLRFDYDEPWSKHFVHTTRGDTTENKAEWRRAWLRREMRGVVLRRTGEVVVRGLHKFFNLGQLNEASQKTLQKRRIQEVLTKLDGQMIVGAEVGDQVQFWSRKGHTAVGVAASRVAQTSIGDYEGLVREATASGCTAVFELVGALSKIKVDEGQEPRLVMVAIREHITGRYKTHEEMVAMGERHHGVAVVERRSDMEQMSLRDLVSEVQSWVGKEGVVVKFEDGTMCKVKSEWWFRAGYRWEDREEAKLWRHKERVRQAKFRDRMRTRPQRVAMWGIQGHTTVETIRRWVPEARKIEMVYKTGGKLSVAIASFDDKDTIITLAVVRRVKQYCQAAQAYSRRTNMKNERTIEVFKFE